LKYGALHGAERYDEAIETFEIMLSKLDEAHEPEMQGKIQNQKCDVVPDRLISRRTPNRQKLLLARPWDWHLLELYDFVEPSNPADNV